MTQEQIDKYLHAAEFLSHNPVWSWIEDNTLYGPDTRLRHDMRSVGDGEEVAHEHIVTIYLTVRGKDVLGVNVKAYDDADKRQVWNDVDGAYMRLFHAFVQFGLEGLYKRDEAKIIIP